MIRFLTLAVHDWCPISVIVEDADIDNLINHAEVEDWYPGDLSDEALMQIRLHIRDTYKKITHMRGEVALAVITRRVFNKDISSRDILGMIQVALQQGRFRSATPPELLAFIIRYRDDVISLLKGSEHYYASHIALPQEWIPQLCISVTWDEALFHPLNLKSISLESELASEDQSDIFFLIAREEVVES